MQAQPLDPTQPISHRSLVQFPCFPLAASAGMGEAEVHDMLDFHFASNLGMLAWVGTPRGSWSLLRSQCTTIIHYD